MKNRTRCRAAVFLAVPLLVSVLAGCAQPSDPDPDGALPPEADALRGLLDPEDPVNLTVWHYYNSTQLITFDDMVLDFNQSLGLELGIFVESYSQGSVNELAEKVLDTARGVAGAGSLPNIFMAYQDTAYEVLGLGLLADLGDYISEESIAEYVPSFWREGLSPIDGQAVIFPVAKATELLYLDLNAWNDFRRAIGDDKAPGECLATWEGVLEAADAYYRYTDSLTPAVEHDGRALIGIDSPANFMLTALRQQGVHYLRNADGQGEIHYDEQALRRAWNTYVVPMADGRFASVGRYRSDDVKTGYLMGYIGSSAGSSYFPDTITFEDGSQREAHMAALPMPVYEGGSPAAVQQGGGMVVSKTTAREEYASVVFLQWLTETDRNLEFALSASYLPVKAQALKGEQMAETLTAMEHSGDLEAQKTARVFRTVLEDMRDYELFFTEPFPGMLSVRYALDEIADTALAARASVQAGLAEGVPLDEAVDDACGDKAFRAWLRRLRETNESILSEAE